jgi:glycosyltransferase involved in cell wall biosynthesis
LKKRVLHCVNSIGGGGAERELRNLLVNSKSSDIEHGLFAWKTGEFEEDIRNCGIPFYLTPVSKTRPWEAITSVLKAIRKWKPDIIQSWGTQFDVVGGIAGRISGIKVIANEQNSKFVYESGMAYKGRWFTQMRPWALRNLIVAAYANSQVGADYLKNDIGLQVPIKVILNGLELDEIHNARALSKRDFGIPDDVPTIVAASRLVAHKRVDMLVRTISELSQGGIHVHLIVCGNGPEQEKIEGMITKLGLSKQVHMLGRRKDVWSVMKAGDVFANPSLVEGMPNSVMEAMACGSPLILSNIASHLELAAETNSAVFFDVDNQSSLTLNLAKVLSDKDQLNQMGFASRDTASKYGIDKMCTEFDKLYKSLLGVN